MIETALIGTVLGAASKMFTGWMQDRSEQKNQVIDFRRAQLEAKEAAYARVHELKMAQLTSSDMAAQSDMNARLAMRNEDTQALIASIEAERAGLGGPYIDALRASVRPFLVFLLTGWVIVQGDLEDAQTVLDVWGMAVGFYFGGRVRGFG